MRTFVDQPTQIFHSDAFDDALQVGEGLQTGSLSLEDDLNALRTQVRQILWANVSGSWYNALTVPSSSAWGPGVPRGVNALGDHLYDVEQHRFLFRRVNMNMVNIATGSNFALLSVSLGTAPMSSASTQYDTAVTGTIVYSLVPGEGTYGSHSMALISSSFMLLPKNLVIVSDFWTHAQITSSLKNPIYGLLQAESGTVSGDVFDDVTKRTQISFVQDVIVNNTASWTAVSPAEIGGRSVYYSYISRIDFDSLPEDAYLNDHAYLDLPESVAVDLSAYAQLTQVTLQRAIDNQGATVVTDMSGTNIQLAAGVNWTFLSGTTQLWQLAAGATGLNTLTMNLYSLGVSSSLPAAFQQGISVATGSTQINVGVLPGVINTLTGNNLVLSGGLSLQFGDSWGGASTYPGSLIPLATSSLEWSNFYTGFGASSILGALTYLSGALSGSGLKRTRAQAGTTTAQFIGPNVNVTYPTNLDAALLNYQGRDFAKDMNIYLNGILLVPGTSAGNPNDVYPGTSAASGDLKFPMKIRSGSIITMELFY